MSQLDIIHSKIMSREQLKRQVAYWKFNDKKIVFTNGCFDILHLGHVDYLAKARDLGGVLILGLNTDASVQRQGKGANRPIVDEHSRSVLTASLRFVDAVILFDEDTPYELIKFIQPDVLVKGNDYKAEEIVGYDVVKANGGEVRTIPLVEGYSTSAIVAKIRKD
ncbi:MAG: D-glycero-beta-D-manno-heptose 1-phosphate adenylyltransferase [Bacteroidia bacterium]